MMPPATRVSTTIVSVTFTVGDGGEDEAVGVVGRIVRFREREFECQFEA